MMFIKVGCLLLQYIKIDINKGDSATRAHKDVAVFAQSINVRFLHAETGIDELVPCHDQVDSKSIGV